MRKSRWLSGLLALALVLTMLPGMALGNVPAALPFWDVIGGSYETPVKALYQIGVVGGTSANTYSPNDPVTRAQMAALLVRSLNLSEQAKQTRFTAKFQDVSTSFWGFAEVMMAEQRGIVRGVSDREFMPGAGVTYAQAVTMTIRALGHDNGRLDYPTGYVLLAQELGLLEGLKWSPNGEMNRAEVAVLLANAIFKVKHKDFNETLSQKYFRVAISHEITPTDSVLTAGNTQLTVIGKDAYGAALSGITGTWRVTQGSATISAGGLLNATQGNVTVEATVGTQKVTRSYRVLSNIAITPAATAIKPGDSVQLKAVDAAQTSAEISGVNWSVVSGPATITAAGRLTVNGSGNVTVKATVGNLEATATFYSVTSLRLEPATATVVVGETVKFQALQPNGTPYTGQVEWSLQGSGVITQDGTYTAGSGSAPTIQVKAGEAVGTATVKVIHRLTVTPGPDVVMSKTKTQQFTAKAVTTAGEQLDVPVTWSAAGRIGIPGADGLFVATTPGTGKVTATYRSLQQSVNVAVADDPYMVTVTASRTSFPANGRSPITLTAKVTDINGLTVNMETPIQFYLNDPSKGSLNVTTARTVNGVATVTLTPSTMAGTFRVTAAASELAILAGMLDMTSYAAAPARIRLEATPNPVASATNSRATVSAVLIDSEGYEIMNTTGGTQVVTLSYTNTTAATLSSNLIAIGPNQSRGEVFFNAGNPGDITIHGAANYPVDSVTVKTLVVGSAAKLAIRPTLVQTRADGSTDLVVHAEIQDANGVVRTQDFGQVVTLTGVSEDGLSNLSSYTASVQSGVAVFRVRSTKAGKFTLTATTAGLASATAQATFTPGPATGLKLSVLPTAEIAADGASTVRLRAEIVDGHGNLVPSASGTISFHKTANQNATALPANVSNVAAIGGVAEILLTATVFPGRDTFRASMQGIADSSTVDVTSRITGVPAKVVASVSSGATTVGNRVTVTVQVQDSRGYVVTSANGRQVRLVSNSPTATITGTGLTEAGVTTFTVTDTKAGLLSLSVTSDGLVSDSSKAVQFAAGAAARVNLKLSSNEMSSDNGQSWIQLSAEVQDAYGNVVNQALGVNLTLDRNDVATLGSPSLYTGSFVMVRSTFTPGSVTISGTSTIPVTPVTLSTHIPGAPAKVRVDPVTTGPAGTALTFQVRVIDTNGRALTSLNTGSNSSAVGVIIAGGSGQQTITNNNLFGLVSFVGNGTTHGSATLSNGSATFTYFTNKAETVTVTPVFYYNGGALPVEAGTITTTPGKAVNLVLTPGRNGLSSASAQSTIVEAKLVDFYGNVVATEVDTINFSFSTTAYINTTGQTSIPTNNGQASLQVASAVHDTGGSTTITATSVKTGLSASATIVTDRPPSAPIIYVSDTVGRNFIGAGEPSARVVLTVDARNTSQTVTAYVNGIQVNLYQLSTGGSQHNTILPGQTTLVAYILRSDLGGAGDKTIRVVVQNAVAPSPMSNTQSITVQ